MIVNGIEKNVKIDDTIWYYKTLLRILTNENKLKYLWSYF